VTRVLLVRHGQSEWNAQGRWQGQADPHLSDHGREEARLAASALEGFDGIVFSSPLLRARETAEIISSKISDGSVFVEPDLREIDVGEFSGLTNDEIEERLPDAWRTLREGKLEAFPGGEARAHFLQRVLGSLERIAGRHADANVLAVAHGGAIAAVERHLGVHPGHGVGNLVGRWFVLGDGELKVDGDRIAFADQPS
jgi:broad specificity phosphatase PhoE